MDQFPIPTDTPDAWGGGEGGGPQAGSVVDVWVLENGIVRKIGQMQNCFYEFSWARSEDTFIAEVMQMGAVCSDLLFNIVHLDGEILPVYSGVIDSPDAVLYGPSPSGERLFYNVEGVPYIIDFGSFISEEVDVPGYDFGYGDWIDESNLLVYFKSSQDSSYSIGILNLTREKITGLVLAGQPPLEYGEEVRQFWLSPDNHWLAFTTWVEYNYHEITLWLYELDLP